MLFLFTKMSATNKNVLKTSGNVQTAQFLAEVPQSPNANVASIKAALTKTTRSPQDLGKKRRSTNGKSSVGSFFSVPVSVPSFRCKKDEYEVRFENCQRRALMFDGMIAG